MAYTTIDDSGLFFNTILYTGDGTTKTISGVGFQPDMVWGKGRNSVSSHSVIDAVRGVTKSIFPDTDAVEDTNATSYLTGFTADGYTVNSASNFNVNTRTQVNWNWKANGAGALNEVGSINSTVSVNTTAGFSIVKWTGNVTSGATVGHGLGTTPKMIIVKNLDSTQYWCVYHEDVGNTKALYLNVNDAQATSTAFWNDTSPTTSVFSLGSNNNTNGSGEDLIAYCFAEVAGYSKFGSYDGNNNADGNFIYTGMKPSFIIIKRYSSTDDWVMFDNKREGYNANNDILRANTDAAEGNSSDLDILSNGFKLRSTWTSINTNSGYIYMAFGQPIISNSGVCATAR